MQDRMKRRHFIKTAALGTLGGLAIPAVLKADIKNNQKEKTNISIAKKSDSDFRQVKFSAFADIHHYPGNFYSQTPKHLEMIQERAVRENVDFMIHAGDFTHNPPAVKDFIKIYNDFKIPSYHVLGNHDQDGCSFEKTLECYQMSAGHYYYEEKGFRFIVFDPNYIRDDNKYYHYTNGNYYKCKDICHVPPEQLEWLKATINESSCPCVLISHQSVEREACSVQNWYDVRKIINDANKKKPGRVRLVINGHHHCDFIRILDKVVYLDLNSASYDWIEKQHEFFPKDLCEKYKLMNRTIVYNDPVHAVITLDYNGLIKIDGMESSLFQGIDRKKAGVPETDSSGRPTFPRVQSMEITMNWDH